MTHLQNIQHSKLHRLGIFFSEPLDVLGISHFTEFVRDIGVSILRLVTQLWVRNMNAFDEQIQQLCKLQKNIVLSIDTSCHSYLSEKKRIYRL